MKNIKEITDGMVAVQKKFAEAIKDVDKSSTEEVIVERKKIIEECIMEMSALRDKLGVHKEPLN